MKNPGAAHTGVFARNFGIVADSKKVTPKPSDCNSIADLLRDFPIVAAHWFGLDQEAPNVH